MKNISEEIQDFLIVTGLTQIALAKASNLSPSTICNLLKRNRKDLMGSSKDRLRAAMDKLSMESSNAAKA